MGERGVHPIYAQCPHCGFPAVITGLDRHLSRYCRQCRGTYVPSLAVADQKSPKAILDEHAKRSRFRLLDRVRQKRRKAAT